MLQVKTNLGHSEGASGLSSLIKMTLALENNTIPPNLNFVTPNPKSQYQPTEWPKNDAGCAASHWLTEYGAVTFEECKLVVPTEPLPWPKDRDQVVVNSFGIGGLTLW